MLYTVKTVGQQLDQQYSSTTVQRYIPVCIRCCLCVIIIY